MFVSRYIVDVIHLQSLLLCNCSENKDICAWNEPHVNTVPRNASHNKALAPKPYHTSDKALLSQSIICEMPSRVKPVLKVPSLYVSSKPSSPTESNYQESTPNSLPPSVSRYARKDTSPTALRPSSPIHVDAGSASRPTLCPSASRSTLQIYSPTAPLTRSHTYDLTASSSRSSLQIQNRTPSPNLLHPDSANTSRISVWQPPSPSANLTTSEISLVSPSSAGSSTSKLLELDNNPPPKTSVIPPTISSHPAKQRQPPKWLQWLPNFSAINERVLALSVTITLALLVLIGVPLGAILPQRYVVQLPVNVIVPFYVSPVIGAWDKLYRG
jgi:hypothetical protein